MGLLRSRQPGSVRYAIAALASAGTFVVPAAVDATPGSPDPRNEATLARCGTGDERLAQLATSLAQKKLRGETMPRGENFVTLVRNAGVSYPWPRWHVIDEQPVNRERAAPRLREWLQSLPEPRRCGVGSARDASDHETLVVIAALASGSFEPLPHQERPPAVGQWIELRARVWVAVTGARIVVAGPQGTPFSPPSWFRDGSVITRFAMDRPGVWKIQAVGDTATGTLPLAETLFTVGTAGGSTTTEVPGVHERGPTDEATVLAMLNAARSQSRLTPVVADLRLQRVAEEHAKHVAQRNLLAHDLGEGGPDARAAKAGVAFTSVGENIAHATALPAAHEALWASPSHRRVMLNASFRRAGIGIARGTDDSLWVVQVFAAP